jgi:hypothetical protein
MGGPGSSRWHGYSKKRLVEDCLILSASPLKSALGRGSGEEGTLTWARNGQQFASMGIRTESSEAGLAIRLTYSRPARNEPNFLDYQVRVVSHPVHLGGVRWCFLCPLASTERRCERPSTRLYLPSNELRFGCRKCLHLTYRSSQESQQFDMLSGYIAALIDSFDSQMI